MKINWITSLSISELIQLPPTIQIVEGLEALKNILPHLDRSFRYAVERHRSWFQDLAYNLFANNKMCFVWSQYADIHTPPIVTSDFVFVRFISDRTIQEKNFGQIQIDRIKEMKKVARNFKDNINEGNLSNVRCYHCTKQSLRRLWPRYSKYLQTIVGSRRSKMGK